MINPNNDSKRISDHNTSALSRRGMIKTIGLGLSVTALPSFMMSAITEVSVDALDHGEQIIPVEEKDFIKMQKFIEDCIAANKESNSQEAVKEVLAKSLSNPSSMLNAIGEPTEAGLKVFLRSKDLTIFAASWTPQMNLMPHNHYYVGQYRHIYRKRRQYHLGTY